MKRIKKKYSFLYLFSKFVLTLNFVVRKILFCGEIKVYSPQAGKGYEIISKQFGLDQFIIRQKVWMDGFKTFVTVLRSGHPAKIPPKTRRVIWRSQRATGLLQPLMSMFMSSLSEKQRLPKLLSSTK